MKYYQISVSSEPKIIGVNNGIYQVVLDTIGIPGEKELEDFRAFAGFGNKNFWNRQDELLNYNIPIIPARKLGKAKITDIMGYTPLIGFLNLLYSKKFISIINNFKVYDYKLFQVMIKGIDENFYLLFVKKILMQEINYLNSVVYTGYQLFKTEQYHEVYTYEQFQELQKLDYSVKFEKICIDKSYDGHDIIAVHPAVDNFYSERLIDNLLAGGITGLDIKYESSILLEFA